MQTGFTLYSWQHVNEGGESRAWLQALVLCTAC
jgi:hypothetical protein